MGKTPTDIVSRTMRRHASDAQSSKADTRPDLNAGATIENNRAPIFPNEHPQRFALTNELHARPFVSLKPPVQASMYASAHEGTTRAAVFQHLADLCDRFGILPPDQSVSHFAGDFGPFRLRFEHHTEFASYTVIRNGSFAVPFEKPASDYLPRQWLEGLPGKVLVATHIAVLPLEGTDPERSIIEGLFVPESLVTSVLSGGAARVWTDLRIHSDGHNRILLKPYDLPPVKAGRVVQRLLEVAAYRNFALLALPVAREIGPELQKIDAGLVELTAQTNALVDQEMTGTGSVESDLLSRLMRLSTEIETLNSTHSYRFSASRAYFALVQARMVELREERVEGFQTIQEFLERRLAPAMRTCESVEGRMSNMSQRATRAANLLRTRIDFSLEQQNQNLLSSMDRRANMQLRLQQTVEGLSIAAITYYAVGLVGYLAYGAAVVLPFIDPKIVQAIAVPVIAGSAWLGLKRIRRHLYDEN